MCSKVHEENCFQRDGADGFGALFFSKLAQRKAKTIWHLECGR
jgi:hypothetical protein